MKRESGKIKLLVAQGSVKQQRLQMDEEQPKCKTKALEENKKQEELVGRVNLRKSEQKSKS